MIEMDNAVVTQKIKLACYWACSCGGCDVSILDTDEKLLELAEAAEIVFWPIAVDAKIADVEAMPDRSIDLCLFNGSIRNSENEKMAKLFRQKSKVLVAFGTCSHIGGIHGLLNTTNTSKVMETVFSDVPSVNNPDRIIPGASTKTSWGELELPDLFDSVYSLDQVVDVDYYVPGCPPAVARVKDVIDCVLSGILPEKGAVLGAQDRAQCDTCPRRPTNEREKTENFNRPHLWEIDSEKCFLEQGMICLGPVTRAGCGEQCIRGNMPCSGCYGPTPEIVDSGGAMISVLASLIRAESEEEILKITEGIEDPLGKLYQFSLCKSLLRRVKH